MTRDEKFKMLVEAGAFDHAMQLQESTDRGKLAGKLSEVYDEVHNVEKTGRNDHHNYDYVEEQEVARKIRKALSERGVWCGPSIDSMSERNAGKQTLTTLKMSYVFVDNETGARIERTWIGQGSDHQDKGAYKGMTGGQKYFLLKAFMVPTGDDPEQDRFDADRERLEREAREREKKEQREREEKLKAQRRRFHAIVGAAYEGQDDRDEKVDAVREYTKSVGKVSSFNDLTLDQLSGLNDKIADWPTEDEDGGNPRREWLDGKLEDE